MRPVSSIVPSNEMRKQYVHTENIFVTSDGIKCVSLPIKFVIAIITMHC